MMTKSEIAALVKGDGVVYANDAGIEWRGAVAETPAATDIDIRIYWPILRSTGLVPIADNPRIRRADP